MVELVDTLDLGSNGFPCRFESCCPHQTNIIRTRSSQWETGSDLLFSSANLRTRISETVLLKDLSQNQEAQEKRNKFIRNANLNDSKVILTARRAKRSYEMGICDFFPYKSQMQQRRSGDAVLQKHFAEHNIRRTLLWKGKFYLVSSTSTPTAWRSSMQTAA